MTQSKKYTGIIELKFSILAPSSKTAKKKLVDILDSIDIEIKKAKKWTYNYYIQ